MLPIRGFKPGGAAVENSINRHFARGLTRSLLAPRRSPLSDEMSKALVGPRGCNPYYDLPRLF